MRRERHVRLPPRSAATSDSGAPRATAHDARAHSANAHDARAHNTPSPDTGEGTAAAEGAVPEGATPGDRAARSPSRRGHRADHHADRHPPGPRTPAGWALWRRPPWFIGFLVLAELLAVAGVAFAAASAETPTATDWLRLALLFAGATVHIQLTRRQEERRRSRMRSVLIDLNAVWVFPAVLVLPVTLTVALIVAVRAQRWLIARRPAHNFVFSTVAHCFAAALAATLHGALGPADWDALTPAASLREFALILLAAAVYEGVQLVYVGGAIALSGPAPTLRGVLGSTADNLLEAVATGLGAVTAVLLVTLPPAVLIMTAVAVAFNRLAEIEQLQADAASDPKTGLRNMRGWSEAAGRALSRIRRADGTLAVLMIDLDHFKDVNDTYGHPAGDDVLARVAGVLREATRPADIVGRFGGEEFLLLLPDADAGAARRAAERIRATIADLHIDTTDKRGSHVTIAGPTASVGIAVYPDHATTLDGLTQAADAAVYTVKETGRDAVYFAEPADG
ncbi:GGDEF domain-containing protein [Prauserella alba]|uniref:GGDEF domain-containing protein n=1 Tax=Prauserella alba TaxID=176898 RepID=UPI0027E231C7|nr:GGDEF domain-containing protein [Prauserella alba]MCP2179262.1 diguanylate cyclase (GGDEF) domain-containing protein [Prauserella alba]